MLFFFCDIHIRVDRTDVLAWLFEFFLYTWLLCFADLTFRNNQGQIL